MQDAYLLAMGLRPPVILGRQMRPFAAAHLMALECAGSPLVNDSTQTTPADLLLAIFICSHAWPFPWMAKPPAALSADVAAWSKKVSGRRGLFRRRYAEWDFLAVLTQWLDYFRAYMTGPERAHKPGEGAAVRAPAAIKLTSWLVRTLHLSEAEAWNMPICRALAYKAGCDVLDSAEDLLDEETIAVLNDVDAAGKTP